MFTAAILHHWDTEDGVAMANKQLLTPRDRLAMSTLSDMDLANRQYMVDRGSLSLLSFQTAAKERIRWLSAHLAIRDQLIRDYAAERATFLSGETPQLREIGDKLMALVGAAIDYDLPCPPR